MVEHCCSDMQYMIEEEQSIIFLPEFREYGVPILDGGYSFLQMSFAPGAEKNCRDLCGRNTSASLTKWE